MLSWNKRGEASLSQEREERRRKIEMAEIDPLLTRPSSRRSVRLSTAFRRRSSRRSAAPRIRRGKKNFYCVFVLFSSACCLATSLSLSLPLKIKMGEDHACTASLLSHLIRAKEQFIQNKATTVLPLLQVGQSLKKACKERGHYL